MAVLVADGEHQAAVELVVEGVAGGAGRRQEACLDHLLHGVVVLLRPLDEGVALLRRVAYAELLGGGFVDASAGEIVAGLLRLLGGEEAAAVECGDILVKREEALAETRA